MLDPNQPSWQGKPIPELNTLVLIQAYKTCLKQEQSRLQASKHPKFHQGFSHPVTKRDVPPMEFPPPNPVFLKVKAELLNELNKRNIKVEI